MRLPAPRTLFAAGLMLLVVSVVGTVLFGGTHARRGGETTVTTSPSPSPSPSPPAAFAVAGALTRNVGAYAATVTWQTTGLSTARVTWGPAGMEPLLWTDSKQLATAHAVELTGLASSTAYVARVEARSPAGETGSTTVSFTTGPAPADAAGSTRAGVVLVNGQPFFPLMVWQECPSQWAPDVADGIDLFAGNACTGLPSLLASLQGHALAAGTSEDAPATSGPGLLGWFYPDEADGRGLTAATMGPPPGTGLRFLTLTAHFYSGAAALPAGRGIYPELLSEADVVGFDFYPLQELCRPDLLAGDFDAQQELVRLAASKPTFQWIEVRQMQCADPSAAVKPDTIRVESWLALAGGAHGLGFFPNDWGSAVGATLSGIAARIRQLEPALLRPALPVVVEPTAPAVRASVRELDGALYVVAVNAGSVPERVQLSAPELGARVFVLAGGQHVYQAGDGKLAVRLPPLSVRIYVAPPR